MLRKDLEKSIIYNLVESNVNRMYEELEVGNNYCYLDKCELKEELEFVNNESLLVYSYNIVSKDEDDNNDYYLVIVVEKDRVLYLILDDSYNVIEEYILKEEELNDMMYL